MRLLFIRVAPPDKSNPCPATDRITNLQPARQKVTNQIVSVITKNDHPHLQQSVRRQSGHAGAPSCPPAGSAKSTKSRGYLSNLWGGTPWVSSAGKLIKACLWHLFPHAAILRSARLAQPVPRLPPLSQLPTPPPAPPHGRGEVPQPCQKWGQLGKKSGEREDCRGGQKASCTKTSLGAETIKAGKAAASVVKVFFPHLCSVQSYPQRQRRPQEATQCYVSERHWALSPIHLIPGASNLLDTGQILSARKDSSEQWNINPRTLLNTSAIRCVAFSLLLWMNLQQCIFVRCRVSACRRALSSGL